MVTTQFFFQEVSLLLTFHLHPSPPPPLVFWHVPCVGSWETSMEQLEGVGGGGGWPKSVPCQPFQGGY